MKRQGKYKLLIIALAAVFALVLSCAAVFADTDTAADSDAAGRAEEPPASCVIEKDGYLYFTDPETGDIVQKAGFYKDFDGRMYYVRKGVIGINRWTIIQKKTFKVSGKYYRAGSSGAIKTGVYKWGGKYYYSKPSTGQWIKKEKIVKWNKKKYYIQSGGVIFTDGIFSFENIPYKADAKGRLKEIAIPDGGGNAVIKIAKEQVGIMTGKTYWVWYFKTKFLDTDRTPWCGAFVAWCYNQAGQYEKVSVATKYGNLGYVPTYSRYANNYGKWIKNKKAKGGDIIVFGSNMHVGLVEGISDGYIVTIEGNAGPTAIIGCGKPGAVVRKVYEINSSRIKGVIRP